MIDRVLIVLMMISAVRLLFNLPSWEQNEFVLGARNSRSVLPEDQVYGKKQMLVAVGYLVLTNSAQSMLIFSLFLTQDVLSSREL